MLSKGYRTMFEYAEPMQATLRHFLYLSIVKRVDSYRQTNFKSILYPNHL